VAGVGNIFLGDDGFGVEVAQRLQGRVLPEGTKLMDVGIRGLHLAYELLDGYDLLLLVDAMPVDEALVHMKVYPNRPDCLGLVGIARELAALLDLKLVLPGILGAQRGSARPAGVQRSAGAPPRDGRQVSGAGEAVRTVLRLVEQGPPDRPCDQTVRTATLERIDQ